MSKNQEARDKNNSLKPLFNEYKGIPISIYLTTSMKKEQHKSSITLFPLS